MKPKYQAIIISLCFLIGWVAIRYAEKGLLDDITEYFGSPVAVYTTKVYHTAKMTNKISMASWYDYKLGDIWWSKTHRTSASRDYPRGTYLKITNIDNEKSVVVFVNDYVENPKVDIDLSSYAFSQLADLKLGLIRVKIELTTIK
jgi:rare lipoprotein A (peptidoglycan hydrolase)